MSSPLARLAKVLPGRPETPEPWLLGSSPQSAVWAGELGLPYAFADFINSGGSEIAALYRREFREGVRLDAPRTVVALWALAADSEEEAERLSASSRMAFTMLRRGRLIAVPPVARSLTFGSDVARRALCRASSRAVGVSVQRSANAARTMRVPVMDGRLLTLVNITQPAVSMFGLVTDLGTQRCFTPWAIASQRLNCPAASSGVFP